MLYTVRIFMNIFLTDIKYIILNSLGINFYPTVYMAVMSLFSTVYWWHREKKSSI